jgi:hypothetical protein
VANSRIKTALIVACLAMVHTACSLAPATIHVHDSMWPVANLVEDEAREAIQWFCDKQGLRDCAKWQHGLRVYIVPGPAFGCGSVEKAVGCHTKTTDTIIVIWDDGPGHNAFLHELYHRRLAKIGDPDWGAHTVGFLLLVGELKRDWRIEMEGAYE